MTDAAERHQVLVDLWVRAGQPSVRGLVRDHRIPRSTVRQALTGERDTKWSTASRLIIALGGDPEDYRPLWIPPPAPRIPAPRRPKDPMAIVRDLVKEVALLRQEVASLREEVSG